MLEEEIPSDEEFEQRGGTINYGGDYEYLIPALYALRCIFRQDVKNIWLACNVEGLGAFDDVFLQIEYNNSKKRVYVIQLKHVKAPIENRSFTDKKRKDFNLHKYYESYQAIEKGCGSPGHFLENVSLEDITFVLYSTADFLQANVDKLTIEKLNITLEKYQKFIENRLLNTKGNIYKFRRSSTSEAEGEADNSISPEFLSNFYLFTKQNNIDGVQQLIYEAINAQFDQTDDNIKMNFIEYLKISTARGKSRKLQKYQLQAQLAEIVLTPYIIEPEVSINLENAEIWNELTQDLDVIILKQGLKNLEAKIWSAINAAVVKHIGTTISGFSRWLEPVSNKFRDDLFKKYKNSYLESVLKEIGSNKPLTLKILYMVLWKSGVVPLFLKVDSEVKKGNVSTAIKLIKAAKNKKHFVVIADDFQMNGLNTFRFLKDLAKDKIGLLHETPVCLQGRHLSMKFEELLKLNSSFKKCISSELILEMLHVSLTIGKRLENLPEYYVERRISKPGVHKNALNKLKQSVFLIQGSQQTIKEFKTSTGCLDYSELKPKSFHEEINIITTSSNDKNIFRKVCDFMHKETKRQNVHKLRIQDDCDYLEWLESNDEVEELRPFLNYSNFMMHESQLLENLHYKTNIICANPGMGKTIMTKYLALNYFADFWIVKINLTDHAKTFNEMQNFSGIFDYFFNMTCEKGEPLAILEFTKAVFATLVKNKKVCIICDGFDEASYLYFEKVSQLLKHLNKEGYHLWIMGRPVVHHHLESLFNLLSLDLKPLNAEDQLNFLQKYYTHVKGAESSQFIANIKQIITNSFSTWKRDFSGVPLHIRMIASIFIQEDSVIHTEINLIDLYERFIDNKLNIYWRKLCGDNENAQFQALMKRQNHKLKLQHVKASLILFYSRELLENIVDFDDLEEFLQEIKDGDCSVGIIVGVNDKSEPIFEHRSFAEYLAAKWLSENFKKKKFVYEIFQREHREVRRFFDRMLAAESVLHLAVLNSDLQKIDELIAANREAVDKGGRTVLHLAASWSLEHVFPSTTAEDDGKLRLNTQEHYIEPLSADHRSILLKLLDAGLSPNQKDTLLEWTAMDYADKTRCFDVVEEFAKRLDFDTKDLSMFLYKSSLLYFCAKFAYVNIFKRMKEEHPLIVNEVNQNLVHVTAQSGSAGILEQMLKEHRQIYGDLLGLPDKFKRTPLYYACRGRLNSEGEIENADYTRCAHILIKEGVEVNENDEKGYTPLHAAAEDGNEEVLKSLISSGADVNHPSNNGSTSLQVAAYKGYTKCVLELAENNADVNASNEYGQSALSFAATFGYVELLRELIKLQADVNKCVDKDVTPLHLTILFVQNKHCVQALISAGADVNFGGESSITPLYVAAQKGKKDLVKALIKAKANVNLAKNTLFTPLHVAAREGHIECIKSLLGSGAKVNAESSEGITPLHESAREGHVDVLQFLLKSRAIVNHVTNNGNTPLHEAINNGHLECVQELIKNKTDVNAQANDGATPLNIAARHGRIDIITVLLKAKAQINFPPEGDTPLHLACFYGNIDCIKFLIQRGAIANVANPLGITPLHIVAKEGIEAVDILVKAQKSHPEKFVNKLTNFQATPLALSMVGGQPEITEQLILHGADINGKDIDGSCLLFIAVSNGHFNVAKVLIEKGIDVNHYNNEMCTPLAAAVSSNRIDFVELLMENGADVNAECLNKVSILQHAVFCGFCDVVKYLVENGADKHYKNVNNKSALDLAEAIYSPDHEILYYLNQN